MSINASWAASAAQYVAMYRYGQLAKQWQAKRRQVVESFVRSLKSEQAIFADFFAPGQQEYADRLDWELKQLLLQA